MSRRPLLPWADALAQVLDAATPLPVAAVPTEADLHGQVLGADVHAQWDLPSADVSVMDGYAARTADLADPTPRLRRVGESAAGHPMATSVEPGCAARISTGAVVPAGADVVIPQEDVRVEADALMVDRDAFGVVEAGRWIRRRGSDVMRDDVVLPAGQRLRAGDLAMAASTGNVTLPVHRRPRVAIVSTGDELVPRGQTPPPGRVVSSNDLMLTAAIRAAGGVPVDHGHAPDDAQGLAAVLRGALEADIVVTTGGISVGDHDLVAATFASEGVTWAFHGIALRPGKPLAFGRRGSACVFGLPGNPASTFACFELFVAPAIRRRLGVQQAAPPTTEVTLRTAAKGAGSRTHFVRARLHDDGSASVLDTQTSGNLRSLCGVDCMIEVPSGVAGLNAGDTATAYPTAPRWGA
ncbi:MAG: gephyrin-like molybdotransferase Glp [Myxococcota bacterium]